MYTGDISRQRKESYLATGEVAGLKLHNDKAEAGHGKSNERIDSGVGGLVKLEILSSI